jgi:hypothetical protein
MKVSNQLKTEGFCRKISCILATESGHLILSADFTIGSKYCAK